MATEYRYIWKFGWGGFFKIHLVKSQTTGWITGVVPIDGGPPGLAGKWKHVSFYWGDDKIINLYWYDAT
jgi:hypothetical protein